MTTTHMSQGTEPLAYRLAAGEEATLLAGAPWRRFAVIGDSIAEGIGEATEGFPDQGWADSVAQALQRASGEEAFAYVNLGKRDLRAAAIRETQLDGALEFRPDLAAVTAGGNDLLRSRFAPEPVAADIDAMVAALRAGGADVVTFGLYDCSGSPYIPDELRGPLRDRLHHLNDLTAAIARRHGAVHVDFTNHAASADPSLYGSDGLHGNRRGHAFTAAHTLRTLAAARLGPTG